MAEYRNPSKVLPIGAIMVTPEVEIQQIEKSLKEYFRGEVILNDRFLVQNFTDYYNGEMGDIIYKYFFYIDSLHPIEGAEEWKIWSNMQEEKYKSELDSNRPANIDPGYLALSKLVLFSAKGYAHRIYIRNKIYAELTLQYRHKSFHSLPWTYSDYQTPEALRFWEEARARLHSLLGQSTKYSGIIRFILCAITPE